MVENNLYKTTQEKADENYQDVDSTHYAAIPVITSSRPSSAMYTHEGMVQTTPNHSIKQSDNPLYSSAQELRMSSTYDTIPRRSRSRTPSEVRSPSCFNSNAALLDPSEPTNYDLPRFENRPGSSDPVTQNTSNNRLSYGLELEFSNRDIVHVQHKRSLSQNLDSIYTEL